MYMYVYALIIQFSICTHVDMHTTYVHKMCMRTLHMSVHMVWCTDIHAHTQTHGDTQTHTHTHTHVHVVENIL